MFNIANWYWIVGDDQNKVWSSAKARDVGIADVDYQAWLVGNQPTAIPSKEDLAAVFTAQFPAGMLETYNAARRWQKEVGGMNFSGATIATDDRSQSKVMGLRVKADANPDFTTKFKTDTGDWIDVNAASIIALSDAVFAHVDSAFSIEEEVSVKIASGEITTIAQIDAAFA